MMAAMPLLLHRFKKRLAGLAGVLADWALFIGLVLIGGLGSSYYMVEAGSRLTTERVGPWVRWIAAARTDADPYTRAHFARVGMLPLSAGIAETYLARADSDGQRLHSSCEYIIEGREFAASWWSLSVFDDSGRLIPNPAQRYGWTSDTIALGPDGSFVVTLARDARPGNWLPTGGAGRLAILLSVLEPQARKESVVASRSADGAGLPDIRRVQCR